MLFKVLIRTAACTVIAAGNALAGPSIQGTEMAARICPSLEPGDLVFKGASTALWTELAAGWSDPADRRWGHVGLVLRVQQHSIGIPAIFQKQDGCAALIVHADTGSGPPGLPAGPGEDVGKVRAVPLEDFLGDVDHAGVFRLKLSPEQRARMLSRAGNEAERQTPFDRGYNLGSENNLYCTELIWRAMSDGLERDAIPDKSHRMGRTYIALSDLSMHPLAEEVIDLTNQR